MTEPVTIESLAAGGDGVGHLEDGRVVFVPRTAVGDVVRLELVKQKKSFARGEVAEMVTASSDRVEPACPLFAKSQCGGCQWMHLSPDAQRAAKADIAAAALRHAIAGGLSIGPVETPTPPVRWRRRARLHWFRPRNSETAIIGFVAPRSRRVFAFDVCLQLESTLEERIEQIRAVLGPHLHKAGELDVLLGDAGDAVVAVRGPVSKRGLEALADTDNFAGVSGRNIAYGEDTVLLDGLPTSAGGFAQASRSGTEALATAIGDWLPEGGRVLELYAGSGGLTAAIAGRARSVLAVDREAGPTFEADNVTWSHGDAAETCAALAEGGERFDAVVLDPPRSGAAECVDPLLALAPGRILYVSCDPATLARDVRALTDGYRAVRALPFDLMPQTSHVELILELTRD